MYSAKAPIMMNRTLLLVRIGFACRSSANRSLLRRSLPLLKAK